MKIYVLSHSYECDVEKTKDEGRFLGVYLTKKEAIEKAEIYKKIKERKQNGNKRKESS